jgi:putative phosphoesterase
MKIALLADIHSNAGALSAVLASTRIADVDVLLVAGDLVGYYFEPKAVLQLIQSYEKPFYLVRGNHEEMLLKAKMCGDQLAEINARYGPGIQLALDQLTASEVEWIVNLPHPLEIKNLGCSILLCHGSPFSVDEYVYPDSGIKNLLSSLKDPPDALIMGHTHYSFIKNVDGCLVINPGSVGQPRNHVPGAHWALLDTQTMKVNLFVEPYDITDLQQRCVNVAPHHPYLREVLMRS